MKINQNLKLQKIRFYYLFFIPTWTPSIAKTAKNMAAISTVFPIGFKEYINVWTTSFKPGARRMTLERNI